MKKKILFVNGHLNTGGVEKSLVDILRNFNYEKYDVDLLLFEGLGDYYSDIPKGVNIRFIDLTTTYGSLKECLVNALKKDDYFSFWMKIILTLSNKFSQKFLVLASKLIRLDYYDCAIAFRPGFCAEIVANCVKSNNKICWWHHGECSYNKKTKIRMSKTFKMFNKIVSVSKGCIEMIDEYFGNLKSKIVVIPNMIDIDEIERKSVLENIDISNERKWTFITVGRLSPEKNMINIVNIANELINQNFTDFKWLVIGDGSEYEGIKKRIDNYGLNNYIDLLGRKSNPYPYIRRADIMIHPSLVESFCLTVLEGMALNKPCIVTQSIGPTEFIEQYQNGILTSENPEEISNEIINLINNTDLFEFIKFNSIKVIYNRYVSNVVISFIENII